MRNWDDIKETLAFMDSSEKAFIEDMAALHSALQREIRERDITQEELGEIAGLRQEQISKIFSVNGNPTLQTLHKIAFALGMKITVDKR